MGSAWRKLVGLGLDVREQFRRKSGLQAERWFVTTLALLPYRRMEHTVFARSLLEPLPVVEPRSPVTLRLAREADWARFRKLVLPSKLRHFSHRLAHGRYCFVALDGENLAACCWAATRVNFRVDNLEMRLQPGDAYFDDAFTMPAYRRQGIQEALHLYRLGYMRDLGCRRAVLIVRDENIASLGLIRKLGYQEVDHLSFRRILWKRTYHYHLGKF